MISPRDFAFRIVWNKIEVPRMPATLIEIPYYKVDVLKIVVTWIGI